MTKQITKIMRVAMFVRDNPGSTLNDIAVEFEIDQNRSSEIIHKLVARGALVRSGKRKSYRYHVSPDYDLPEAELPAAQTSPEEITASRIKSETLINQADELESRGLCRRAATLLTEALKYQRNEKDWWRICQRRKSCLRSARMNNLGYEG